MKPRYDYENWTFCLQILKGLSAFAPNVNTTNISEWSTGMWGSSRPEVLSKIAGSKNSEKIPRETPVPDSLFLIKLQAETKTGYSQENRHRRVTWSRKKNL